jgi:hypothetical protein
MENGRICLHFGYTGTAFSTRAASFSLPSRQLREAVSHKGSATQHSVSKGDWPFSRAFALADAVPFANPVATAENRKQDHRRIWKAVLAFSCGCCAAAGRLVWCNKNLENERQARGPVDRSKACHFVTGYPGTNSFFRGETNGQAVCSGGLADKSSRSLSESADSDSGLERGPGFGQAATTLKLPILRTLRRPKQRRDRRRPSRTQVVRITRKHTYVLHR